MTNDEITEGARQIQDWLAVNDYDALARFMGHADASGMILHMRKQGRRHFGATQWERIEKMVLAQNAVRLSWTGTGLKGAGAP